MRKLLFNDFHGNPVYEEDKVAWVNKRTWSIGEDDIAILAYAEESLQNNYAWFIHKEEAQEYITFKGEVPILEF